MNRPHAARNRADGFSLTEMLVVIGIIAVLSAVSLPSLINYFRGSKIRAAQDELATAIQRARNTGIMKNTQMGVVFVTQDVTTYWVHIEDSVLGVAGTATSADVGFLRQPLSTAAPNLALSTQYRLPRNVEFAANAGECPTRTPTGALAGYAPAYVANTASMRFDRYGVPTSPGTGVPAAAGLSGTPATTNRFFVPAAPGDFAICLIDRVTNLRKALKISRSGRVLRDPSN